MSDPLRERYDGLEAALEDVVASVEASGVLHRVDGDGGAWCSTSGDFDYYDMAGALAFGGRLCEACFTGGAEQLARTDGSGVTHADDTPDVPPDAAVETLEGSKTHARLDALTADVLVASTAAEAFHAPASDDTAVCGVRVDGTRRRADQAPPSTHPCRDCFTESVVDEHAPRDATAPIVDAAADGGRRLNE